MKKIVLVAAAALCSASVFAGAHAQGTHFSVGAGVTSGMAALETPVGIGANIGLIGSSFEAKIGFNHSSMTLKSDGKKFGDTITNTAVTAALAYRQPISSNTYWTAGVASEVAFNDEINHAYSIAPTVGVEFAASNNVLVDASIFPVRYSSVEDNLKQEVNIFSFGGASLGVSYLF